MKSQTTNVSFNTQQAHNFTEIERLKNLNQLLKSSNPNAEVKLLESLNNFKNFVEELKRQ